MAPLALMIFILSPLQITPAQLLPYTMVPTALMVKKVSKVKKANRAIRAKRVIRVMMDFLPAFKQRKQMVV